MSLVSHRSTVAANLHMVLRERLQGSTADLLCEFASVTSAGVARSPLWFGSAATNDRLAQGLFMLACVFAAATCTVGNADLTMISQWQSGAKQP